MARLGDICTKITDGSHNPPQGISHSEYLMLSSKNIYDDEITLDDPRYLSAENYAIENKRTQISTGDILLTIVGTVGRAAVVSDSIKNICLQRSVAVIKPKSNLIDSRFLMYQLQSMRTHLEQEARGVAQKGIYLKQVENLQVKVPSMDEQLRVVKKLDKVSELIALRKEQLAKLDELVKSRFAELFGTVHDNKFGHEIKTLQDVCEPIKDGTHQTPTYTDDSVNGYKFLSSKDVTTGKIDWAHLKYIPAELHKELYARIAPKKGDILLAKNGTTGIAAIVDRDEVFDIYVSLALLRPIGINSVYLWAAINSVETKQQFNSSLKGIGVPNLHLGEIKKAKIIVPPVEEQNQFAAFVEQTDKSKLAVQQSLEKLETLKKALMQEYFG